MPRSGAGWGARWACRDSPAVRQEIGEKLAGMLGWGRSDQAASSVGGLGSLSSAKSSRLNGEPWPSYFLLTVKTRQKEPPRPQPRPRGVNSRVDFCAMRACVLAGVGKICWTFSLAEKLVRSLGPCLPAPHAVSVCVCPGDLSPTALLCPGHVPASTGGRRPWPRLSSGA